MRRLISFLVLIGFSGFAVADETALRGLSTGDASRGWEAVGRLNIDGTGFCTAAMIAPQLVLTAAHCLYDRGSGEMIDPGQIEFLAGWRSGRAASYRGVRRAVVHPEYAFAGSAALDRVRYDLALLELDQPILKSSLAPYETRADARKGQQIGIVSYAHDRADMPSLQDVCGVVARQQGVLVMSCDVDFGSSGAPVFAFDDGPPRIVSIVSAKAEMAGQKVALGTELTQPFETLLDVYHRGSGPLSEAAPVMVSSDTRRDIGAKFARPNGN